jgi:Cytosine deaminase and related metal-dependent hydrolases
VRLNNLQLADQSKVDLVIDDGIITSVESATNSGDYDMDGLVVLPGFWAHTHTGGENLVSSPVRRSSQVPEQLPVAATPLYLLWLTPNQLPTMLGL